MTSDGKLTEEEKADILSAFVKLIGQDAMDAPVGEDLTATVLVPTHTAEQVKQEEQHKDRAQANAGTPADAPAGIAPRAAAEAENQNQDEDE